MRKDECFELGIISKLHGISGEVTASLDVDIPDAYAKLDAVFVEMRGTLVPYIITQIQVRGSKAYIKLDGITTPALAEPLLASKMFLPLDKLPRLRKGQFYFHDIVGFVVEDKTLGTLGIVDTVYAMPQQNLLAMLYQDNEVLIPITDTIVTGVDIIGKVVKTDLPEGLLDIYLKPQEAEPEDGVSEEEDAD